MAPASSTGALWYLLGSVLWVVLVLKTPRVLHCDLVLDKDWSLACELIWDFSHALLSGSPRIQERTDGKTEARTAAL